MRNERLSPKQIEFLVLKAQSGDNAAAERVIEYFENDIKSLAHSGKWYIPGAEPKDVMQEARIGLNNAIREYDPKKRKISFERFAMCVCVKRGVITAINRENRRRMDPLNHGVSLSTPISTAEGDSGQTLEDIIPDKKFNVEEKTSSNIEFEILDKALQKILTKLEKKCYVLYKDGHTYREIANKLAKWEKTIDNALMRVRKKAKHVVVIYLMNCSNTYNKEESLRFLVETWGLNLSDATDFWQSICLEALENESEPKDNEELLFY